VAVAVRGAAASGQTPAKSDWLLYFGDGFSRRICYGGLDRGGVGGFDEEAPFDDGRVRRAGVARDGRRFGAGLQGSACGSGLHVVRVLCRSERRRHLGQRQFGGREFRPGERFSACTRQLWGGLSGRSVGQSFFGQPFVIGGGQIGYNWQISSAWIAGFEDDIQGISGKGNGTLGNRTPVGAGGFFGNPDVVTTSITSTNKLDYLGTVRGRLGYLFTPAFLVYGTGGLAYGGVKASTTITQSNNDCAFTPVACIQPSTSAGGAFSHMLAGWTAGAGLEWLFARQWSAKVEYLHYDLGSVTFANGLLVTGSGTFPGAGGPAIVNSASSTQFRGDLVRAGVNFHWY
jgi:opacity protein-like surface antigen